MAASTQSLLDELLARPGRFDFLQAVDLLEQAHRHAGHASSLALVPLGQGSDPQREALALGAAFALNFRAQAIEQVQIDDDGKGWLLTNFFGLAGPDGPLPEAYTELVRAPLLAHDQGAAAFLSIFQHRLLALAYRAADAQRACRPFSQAGAGPLVPALLALLGQIDGAPAREALVLANLPLCVQQRHGLHGLLTLLERQFGVSASGQQWRGAWLTLAPDLHTVLGAAGRNDRLGQGAVLGQRSWCDDGAIGVDLGVIDGALYRALLPGSARHRELCMLCAWYLGPGVCCYLRMALAAADVAAAALLPDCLLGYTSWLDGAASPCAIELTIRGGSSVVSSVVTSVVTSVVSGTP